jgi:TPR repeat protein
MQSTYRAWFVTGILLLLGIGAGWAGLLEDVKGALEAYRRGDYATAARNFEVLANRNVSAAQYFLASMYYEGKGVSQDYPTALKWYRRAADRGYAFAQYEVGTFYDRGVGTKASQSEAAGWFRRAAEQGVDKAQFNLAQMYAVGEGVPRDVIEAFKWSAIAVAHSDDKRVKADAAKLRDTVGTRMTAAQREEAQVRADRWKGKAEQAAIDALKELVDTGQITPLELLKPGGITK